MNVLLNSRGLQVAVSTWMQKCFGPEITADRLERGDRFIEEALELAQTCPGMTAERAHALVDYVFARPEGSREQEVGGVMVTLAALCNAFAINIGDCATEEVVRINGMVEQIRAKQASKPTGSALPVPQEKASNITTIIAKAADWDIDLKEEHVWFAPALGQAIAVPYEMFDRAARKRGFVAGTLTAKEDRARLTGEVITTERDGVPVRRMTVTHELAERALNSPETIMGAATVKGGRVFRPWIVTYGDETPQPDAYLYVLDDVMSAKPIFTFNRWPEYVPPPNHPERRTRFREIPLFEHK